METYEKCYVPVNRDTKHNWVNKEGSLKDLFTRINRNGQSQTLVLFLTI